jgi:hypothetical protein
MKIKYVVLLLVLFISAQTAVNAQNAITDVDSIPILAYLYSLDGVNPNLVYEIDSLRYHSVEMMNLTGGQYSDFQLDEYKFGIIPNQVDESIVDPGNNLIIKYTEAKYSVWQAEGTPPDDGGATLERNKTYTIEDNSKSYIYTISNLNIPKDSVLLSGPSYWQDATYNSEEPGIVNYRADFRMKAEELIPDGMQPTDTLCHLQVTASRIEWINGVGLVVTDYVVIADSAITLEKMSPLSQWLDKSIEYNLAGLAGLFYNDWSRPAFTPQWKSGTRNHVRNIEFKIIWKGNSQAVRLSVDSVTLSDVRGRDLTDPVIWLFVKSQIEQMLQASYITSNYQTKITGWFGLDEPNSLDNFEPIRIISELINNYLHNKRSLASSNENNESQVTDQKDN